jgi:uncharacterized damage-inducible protein DinB
MLGQSGGLSADPLDILLRHDHWATRRVLLFCSEISDERFHQRFDIGPGSLHDTITHVIASVRRWADRIDGRPLRPSLELPEGSTWSFFGPASQGPRPAVPRRSVDVLVSLLDEASADLAGVAARCRARGLGTTFTLPFGAKSYNFTLGAALTHVLTHGTHHRAQCLNMLRQAGAPALAHDTPEIGVADWQAEVETGQLAPYQPAASSPAGRPAGG